MRIWSLLLVIIFTSCEVKVSTSSDKDKPAEEKASYARNTKKIRNGIELKTPAVLK
jgi:hypothetical protein